MWVDWEGFAVVVESLVLGDAKHWWVFLFELVRLVGQRCSRCVDWGLPLYREEVVYLYRVEV